MTSDNWTAWREAEERVERGEDLDATAAGLPARQAWILRALAALDSGDRDALVRIQSEAPAEELRAVAEIALSEPDSIDPTRFRAYLKAVGVTNDPFPALDLLRLACVAHNGEPPTRPPKLAKAARLSPTLEGALMVLSKKFTPRHMEDRLSERSGRLVSRWGHGVAQLWNRGTTREYLGQELPDIEPLDDATWPDLDDRLQGPGGAVTLAQFLDDPLGREWSDLCYADVQVLCTRGARAARLTALGRVLDAIHALLARGSMPAAITVVHAALELTAASPEVRHREVLRSQLNLLHFRLLWWCDALEPELVEIAWSGISDLSVEERAHAANLILDSGRPIPSSVAPQILAFALRGGADPEERVLPWIVENGESITARAFQSALSVTSERMRDYVLGHYHAEHGSTAEACRLAGRMLGRGELEKGEEIAMSALLRQNTTPAAGRRERRTRDQGWVALASSLAACPEPPNADFLGVLISMAPRSTDAPAKVLEAVVERARARLLLPVKSDRGDVMPRLQLMLTLGLEQEAAEAFRAFGRWLRGGKTAETIPAALTACALLCANEEVVQRLANGEEEGWMTAWLRAMTAWLDRHDTGEVARHALALARSGRAGAAALDHWFEEVSDLENDDAWDGLLELSDQDPFGSDFFDAIDLLP